jgi:tripeptidyl-peptidase-1
MDVSHPDSSNYGKHWSAEKVANTFAPSKTTIDAVRGWLHSAGFSAERLRLSASKGWIDINATTTEVERLLDADYHVFSHAAGSEHIGMSSCFVPIFVCLNDRCNHEACDSYSVPEQIREHIDIIIPTLNFDAKILPRSSPKFGPRKAIIEPFVKTNDKQAKGSERGPLANCDQEITPDCLRALYNFYYTPQAIYQNSYGIGMQIIIYQY